MSTFLERLGLKIKWTSTVALTPEYLVSRLAIRIDKGDPDSLSLKEGKSSSRNELIGRLDATGFRVRLRFSAFDMNKFRPIAFGLFELEGGRTRIRMEAGGFPWQLWVFVFISLILFPVFIGMGATALPKDHAWIGWVVITMLHGAVFLGIPYLFARSAVKWLKEEVDNVLSLTERQV